MQRSKLLHLRRPPLLLPLPSANRWHSLVIVWVNANVLAGRVNICAADEVLAAQGAFSGSQLQPGSQQNAERQIYSYSLWSAGRPLRSRSAATAATFDLALDYCQAISNPQG